MTVVDLIGHALNWLARFFPTTSLRTSDTGHCRDVHLLMRCCYDFWSYGGVWQAVTSHLVDALNCIVVAIFVFVMAFAINWDALVNCTADECGPLFQGPNLDHTPGGHTILAIIILCAASAACLFEISRSVEAYFLLSEVHVLLSRTVDCGYITPFHSLIDFWYKWKEGYSAIRLQAVGTSAAPEYVSYEGGDEADTAESSLLLADLSWASFLNKVCELIRHDRSLGIVEARTFDELRAIQVLMVYDNFLISMHHHRVFNGCALQHVDDTIIRFLLSSLFDDYNAFDPERAADDVIRTKLFWYLIAYWTLYPFLISYFMVKMIVRNVALIKTKPSEYMERQWSPSAVWQFRLPNEVVHVVNERCREAQRVATHMSERVQRPSEWYRLVERIASTVVLTVVVMSVVNTTALTSGIAAGRTLVWWLSTAIILHSVVHRPDPTSSGGRVNAAHRLEYFHEADLTKLVHYLHYDEAEWYTSGSRWATTIQWDFFHTRLYLLFTAISRTLLMPLILLRVYSDDSLLRLIEFLQQHSSRVNCVGTMSVEADFRVEGAENLTPREPVQPLSYLRYAAAAAAGSSRMDEDAPAEGGADVDDGLSMGLSLDSSGTTMKKAKSIASFAAIYPKWRRRATENDTLGIATFLLSLDQQGTTSSAPLPVPAPTDPSSTPSTANRIVPPLNLKAAQQQQSTHTTSSPPPPPPPPASSREGGATQRRRTAHEAQQHTVSRLDDMVAASRRFYADQQLHASRSRNQLGQAGGRYGGLNQSTGSGSYEMEDR